MQIEKVKVRLTSTGQEIEMVIGEGVHTVRGCEIVYERSRSAMEAECQRR